MKASTKLVTRAAVISAVALRWQMRRWFAASPRSVRLRRLGGAVELRRYEPVVVARTLAEPNERREGAARLAGFLVGKNHRREAVTEGPVVREMHTHHEHIARSTPIVEELSREHAEAPRAMYVALPEGSELSALPIPDDERVLIEELPARVVGAMRWRGPSDEATVRAHGELLLARLHEAGYEVREGSLMSARYDPPSTLPLLRRNEVWLEIIVAE